MLRASWNDVPSDLRNSVSLTRALVVQVLRNKAVSKEVRRARAQGLHELGGIFQDAAASYVEAAPAQDQVPFHLLPPFSST